MIKVNLRYLKIHVQALEMAGNLVSSIRPKTHVDKMFDTNDLTILSVFLECVDVMTHF